jgi:hypothetical protein
MIEQKPTMKNSSSWRPVYGLTGFLLLLRSRQDSAVDQRRVRFRAVAKHYDAGAFLLVAQAGMPVLLKCERRLGLDLD